MDSQYSESLVGDDYSESSISTHAKYDSSITTEERNQNSSESSSSEEEQSSITTENNFEEEINPWTTYLLTMQRPRPGHSTMHMTYI